MLTDWKSESVTDLPTDGLTWVGARDACASKNYTLEKVWFLDINFVCFNSSLHPAMVQANARVKNPKTQRFFCFSDQ